MIDDKEERITSRQNRWFRRFLAAAKDHDQEIVIEGPKQIADALGAGWKAIAVARSDEEQNAAVGARISFTRALMRELTDTRHPRGVIALFERPSREAAAMFAGERTLIVVLDGIQDPGNVGTIVRLAAAFEATGVAITSGTADPFAPKAVRASAGAILLLPVISFERSELIATLAQRGVSLHAAVTGTHAARLERPAAIAFGSEGNGVSEEILAAAIPVSVPISPRVESLNVAAAAAILLSRVYGN